MGDLLNTGRHSVVICLSFFLFSLFLLPFFFLALPSVVRSDKKIKAVQSLKHESMAHGLCRKMILEELALSQVMFLNMDRLYNKCDHFQKQSRYKRQLE